MFLFAAVQFLAAPILGNLSDRFGRRPVLLISLAALGLDYVLIALAPNMVWLFIGRFISAIASATFATANAWVADVSEPRDRARISNKPSTRVSSSTITLCSSGAVWNRSIFPPTKLRVVRTE